MHCIFVYEVVPFSPRLVAIVFSVESLSSVVSLFVSPGQVWFSLDSYTLLETEHSRLFWYSSVVKLGA